MIKKLIRFALWLGLFDIVDKERETMQRLDQLMLEMASAESWAEYSQIRWDLANVNKPARQPWQDGPTVPVIQNGKLILIDEVQPQ